MRTATELHRVGRTFAAPHGHDPNFVAVLLTEQRESALFHGLVGTHEDGPNTRVPANVEVDVRLEGFEFFGGDRFGVREVEPQPIRRDQ